MAKRARRAHRVAADKPNAARRAAAHPGFLLACTLAYLLVLAVYWPSVHYAPIPLDDESQLQWLTQHSFSEVWGRDHFGHFRPAKNVLFWLIAHDVGGLAVWRAFVLGVFLLSVVLVQRLAARLMDSRYWGLSAALCWALNPTTPSVVCWLSAANIALCLFGMLAYLGFGVRSLRTTSLGSAGAWLLASAATLAWMLALMSHQLAVLAPILLLAYLRAVGLQKPDRALVLPLAVCSVACLILVGVLYFASAAPVKGYRSGEHSEGLLVLSAARYLLENTLLWAWLPGRFGVLLTDDPAAHVLASVSCWVVVLAIPGLLWRFCARDAPRSFALLWSGALLIPLTNLVPFGITPVAVHYLYLPGVGFALLLGRAAQRLAQLRPGSRLALLPPLLMGIVILSWLPEQRRVLAAWQDPAALFSATVKNYPRNLEARVNLVAVYLKQERYPEAEALLARSLELAPEEPALIRNRFELLRRTDKVPEALAFLDSHPLLQEPVYLIRRGRLLERLGRHHEAVEAYRRGLEAARDPEDRLAAGYRLATALVRTHQTPKAAQLIDRLVVEFPDSRELAFTKQLLARARQSPQR